MLSRRTQSVSNSILYTVTSSRFNRYSFMNEATVFAFIKLKDPTLSILNWSFSDINLSDP